MKNFLIVCLLALINSFSSAQETDENQKKKDPFLDHICINPFRSLTDEVVLHFDSYNNQFVKGFMLGFIHPNENFETVGSSSVFVDYNLQVHFKSWGAVGGIKLNPIRHRNFTLNTLLRYTEADNAMAHDTYFGYNSININGIDQNEVSLNINFEHAVDFDFFETWATHIFSNQVYGGLGFKLIYRETTYDYNYNEEGQVIGSFVMDYDNGFFIRPTIHAGIRFGRVLRKEDAALAPRF